MFFPSLRCLNRVTVQKVFYSTEKKWDILTAVCVERAPVLTALPTPLQQKVQEYLRDVESSKSLKSDHEIRTELDLKHEEMLKNAKLSDAELDAPIKQTAQDFEDACQEELSKFNPADCTTEADRKNQLTSLERKLRSRLVLLTEQTIGDQKIYLMPQGKRQEGESLRETAERVLKEACGDNLKTSFFGNAPVGFYKYKYPQEVRKTSSEGAKVFFYYAKYLNGQVSGKDVKYQWLDGEELSKKLPEKYCESVRQFLIV